MAAIAEAPDHNSSVPGMSNDGGQRDQISRCGQTTADELRPAEQAALLAGKL